MVNLVFRDCIIYLTLEIFYLTLGTNFLIYKMLHYLDIKYD